ncbi:MAG: efflux RND transporter periplasmic adaptor subunit [Candidatus Glassbacteria bacterium]|nr:efflux RND transporter periplasmic adaptor subunit [Candidatus Glassbacteria bacterium]
MKDKIKENYKPAIIVVLAALLGWRLYQEIFISGGDTGQNGTATVAVELAPVRKADLEDVGYFTGSLLPRSQYTVAPKISGRLERVLVNIGDPVRFDQLIAVLNDDEYAQQVDKARAELEVVKANIEEARSSLEVSRREFERVRPLHQQGIASDSELDAAQARCNAQEARYKVALAQLSQREAALRESLVRLAYTEIRASWEKGDHNSQVRFVGERYMDEGAMLTPNTAIVSILDINSLIAVIHIIERDYPKVQDGMEAVITTDAFPGRTFSGRIARIAPLLKETSRQARVEIEIPNQDNLLKPGMFIRAKIVFGTRRQATVIPLVALVRREGRQGIFLADTQSLKVRFVPVALGIVNGELAEVVEPAVSGSVVSMGQHLLEDGASITVPKYGE